MKTVQIKLKPTKTEATELKRLSVEYIRQANALIQQAIREENFPRVTSKHIESDIPSVLKNELIRYAKSKHKQFGKCTFKKPMLSYNNQNFSVDATAIRFPIMADGTAKKTAIKAIIPEEMFALLSGSKMGTLRITKKGFHWMAQISVPTEEKEFVGEGILGVDLGILCPAVGVVAADGKTQFFGNGRKNKCLRRKYKELRRQLGKQKKSMPSDPSKTRNPESCGTSTTRFPDRSSPSQRKTTAAPSIWKIFPAFVGPQGKEVKTKRTCTIGPSMNCLPLSHTKPVSSG